MRSWLIFLNVYRLMGPNPKFGLPETKQVHIFGYQEMERLHVLHYKYGVTLWFCVTTIVRIFGKLRLDQAFMTFNFQLDINTSCIFYVPVKRLLSINDIKCRYFFKVVCLNFFKVTKNFLYIFRIARKLYQWICQLCRNHKYYIRAITLLS